MAEVNKDGLVLTGKWAAPHAISIDGEGLRGRLSPREVCDALKGQWMEYLALNPDSTVSYEEYLHNAVVTLMWRIADIEYEYNAGKLTGLERNANIEICKETMAAIWSRYPSIKANMNMNYINMPTPEWVVMLKNVVEVTGIERAYRHK